MTAADRPKVGDDFWEASSLSSGTNRAYGAAASGFEPPTPQNPHHLIGGGPVHPLPPVDDDLQDLLARRRSERTFGPDPVTEEQLARVLAATGTAPAPATARSGDERRLVPEAGSLDTVHTYAVLRAVTGAHRSTVIRYDHRLHAVQPVARVPTDDDVRALFGIEEGLPPVILVFVIDPGPVTAKYGDRGVRFALQQVGHAAQNVSLRCARDGLRGYLLGGGLDREVLGMLGIAHLPVRFGGAFALGT